MCVGWCACVCIAVKANDSNAIVVVLTLVDRHTIAFIELSALRKSDSLSMFSRIMVHWR